MTFQPPRNPLEYPANNTDPIRIFKANRAPTVNDSKNFKIRDFWIDSVAENLYFLVNKNSAGAVWTNLSGGGGGGVNKFNANSGSAVPVAGVIGMAGGTGLTTSAAGGTVTFNLDVPVTVPHGGTGLISLNDGGILLGSGTGAVTVTAQPTDGQVLLGSTGSDPVLSTLTAGTGISVTNGAGSSTITNTAPGIEWQTVSDSSPVTLSGNRGYICSAPAGAVLLLPLTAAAGDVFHIVGNNAGGWSLDVRPAQVVYFAGSQTTPGGTVASTGGFDTVTIVCTDALFNFVIFASTGAISLT